MTSIYGLIVFVIGVALFLGIGSYIVWWLQDKFKVKNND